MAFALLLATNVFAHADERRISFVHDVVPVLTRLGCNAGVCHAKAGGGQNGFQLSLLGFEPADDYEHLVKEAMFKALSEKGINIQAISTSEIKISVLIDRAYSELAVRTLHTLYGLDTD